MILYHAISIFHILTVSVHKLAMHKKEKVILILPDFIVEKLPNYINLQVIFDEIYLFPYTKITHNENTVARQTEEEYLKLIPYKLGQMQKIYVAGAHFYFSLVLIEQRKKFYVFEDARGMLKQHERLYEHLKTNYYIHAEIMKRHNMFELDNPYIKKIFCDKKENGIIGYKKKIKQWNTLERYLKLKAYHRGEIISVFSKEKLKIDIQNSILIMAQNFVGVGSMSLDQQETVFCKLKETLPKEKKIVIKTHPDDKFDYQKIFKGAYIINAVIPIELLSTFFHGNPLFILKFSSTASVFKKNYKVINFSKKYKYLYDYNNEYQSILTILNLGRNLYE